MNDILATLTEYIVWTVNGFLAILYYGVDHFLAIALIAASGFLIWFAPREQRMWTTGSSLLAIAASLISPIPVPLFLLVMALAGQAALALELYNKAAQRWNVVRGQALYALAGLGFAAYRNLGLGDAVLADPMMTQGAGYLNALIGIAMYVIPLGYLAWLAQSIWAHPPSPGTPEEIVTQVRTRGKR